MQERCKAIHHLDPPWKPAEVEQRDGRGPRPGNRHDVVDSLRYVTPGTFDAYSWETLLRKFIFVSQLLVGEGDAREVEDLGDGVLTYAEVKAAATGDPLILELTAAQSEISRLRGLATSHTRTQRRAEQDASADRNEARAAAQRAKVLTAIADTAERSAPGWVSPRGERVAETAHVTEQMADLISTALTTGMRNVRLGTWSGVPVAAAISEPGLAGPPVVTLSVGETSRTSGVTLRLPVGILAPSHRWRLGKDIAGIVSQAGERAEQQRTHAEVCRTRAAERDALSRKPFEHGPALAAVVARKSEIDELMAEAAAKDAEQGRRRVRTMPEELLSAGADSPLDLPRVVIPASVAAFIEERAEGAQPVPGPRPRLERRADFSETAEVAVGPPAPEVAPWRGRWDQQHELDFDIAALMRPDEQAGEGVGIAFTAAWAAIAPVPVYTQDALDMGELPRTVRTARGVRRNGARRPRLVAPAQDALFEIPTELAGAAANGATRARNGKCL